MPSENTPCPLSREEIIERYFLEHRAKLLDIAAFLDRVDRAQSTNNDDYRIAAMKKAAAELTDSQGDRAKRILEIFSDPSDKTIETASQKGASGAWAGGQS